MRSMLASSLAVATLVLTTCADAPGSDQFATDDTSQGLLASVESGSLRPRIDIAALGFDRGNADAPVRVIEMSDYGCGYCRQFHEETWPTLRKEFVDAGKIQWKFLPFVTGMFKNSAHASLAAECSMEQSATYFEAVNSAIWGEQRAWKNSSNPAGVLRDLVSNVGVDMARYDSCVSENRRRERLEAADQLANQVGVRGTPTFFVVGYPPLQGALPLESFRQVLNIVYADATKAGGETP